MLEVREVDVPAPEAGEVTIEVRAAGMNPVDFKLFSGAGGGGDPDALPMRIGLEVAGVLTAIGPDTQIATGGGQIGDEVLAFRVSGGYASALTVSAADVFAKPATLDFPEAANLLLVGGLPPTCCAWCPRGRGRRWSSTVPPAPSASAFSSSSPPSGCARSGPLRRRISTR